MLDVKSFAAGRNSASGSGETTDYASLSNKPSIGGVTLFGNHAVSDFLTDVSAATVAQAVTDAYDAAFGEGGV